MKRIFDYIVSSALIVVVLCMMGCSSDSGVSAEEGVGVAWHVSLQSNSGDILMSRSGSDDDAFDYSLALSNSVMKIYDTEDRLLRRYEPIDSAPEYIYLTEGDYYVTIVAGESLSPSDNQEDLTFGGSSNFSVSAGISTSISIVCKMLNNSVTVKFDTSIADNFEEGYRLVVAPASEIDDTILSDSYLHKRIFTESGVTYFIQPSDETNIAWQFEGVRKYSDETIIRSDVITDVDAGEANFLTFSYEKELIVSKAMVVVDTSTDDKNDIFEFSPQPTLNGVDFSIDATQEASGGDFDINIDAIYDIKTVSITYGGVTLSPVVDSSVESVGGGISYVATSAISGTLTISNEFFADIAVGGVQTISLNVVDIKDATTDKDFLVTTTGVVGLSGYDFWENTALVSATVVDSDYTSAEIQIRTKGNEEWQSYSITPNASKSYSVTTSPRWSGVMSNDAGLSYYTLEEGMRPNTTYECRVVVDGVARPSITITSENQSLTIPESDFNSDEMSCFSESNSSSTTWASGNNMWTDDLCTQGTRGGATCAYLKAGSALNQFAAGNLMYGQFTLDGTTGKVRFGQYFNWTIRPKTFNFKYSATVGQDSMTSPTGVSYSHDRGRVFFAIVDWSDRREVQAGSGTPSGVWDPETSTSLTEGAIIGYASMYIDESTDSNMHDVEIPIFYYDTQTKPSKNITLVVSCATSAYGDYMTGSTDSRLWIDDITFGY